MLVKNAATKQAERIYVSFFNRLDGIIKSCIVSI
jgi:hypothetical protein